MKQNSQHGCVESVPATYRIAPNFCGTIFHEFHNLTSDKKNFPRKNYCGHDYIPCAHAHHKRDRVYKYTCDTSECLN